MIKPNKKMTFLNREKAQTMVEFALVFPIVLLITYGIIEFGRMVFIYASVTGAARDGARYGASVGEINARNYLDCPGINEAAKRGAILTTITVDQIWYDHGPGTTSETSNSCSPTFADTIKAGDRIGVHVVALFKPMIPFVGVPNVNFTAQNIRTILINIPITYP
jgi:Flp pilus assembly protein TadG